MEAHPVSSPEAREPERCRIERWRGYVTSTLYARASGEMLESRPFRWRHTAPPPDDGDAKAAYESLVARLLEVGWEPEGQGALWYETCFVRAVSEGGVVVAQVSATQPDVPARQTDAPVLQSNVPVLQSDAPVAQPDVRAVQPESPVAPVRRAFRGRPKKVVYAAAAACATLVVLALLLATRDHTVTGRSAFPSGTIGAGQARNVSKVSSTRRAATTGPERARSRQALVDLRIEARGNGSWLELRRVSGTGPVLYSGTLLPGTTLHFRAARIWARMGAAGNLVLTENGRPIQLQGTFDKLFLPPGP
jgi:hypothetical protein